MLVSANRLRRRKDFRRVYQRGKSFKSASFILYYVPNIIGAYRIGFSVSKKIGKAVVRNRVKRKFREAARLNLQAFSLGWDYIFIARHNAIQAKSTDLAKEIVQAAAAIKLKPRQAKKSKR